MKSFSTFVLGITLLSGGPIVAGGVPTEPLEIGVAPQFFVDDWLVSNRVAIKYKREAVLRRFHVPVKHERNPLFVGDVGYVNVVRDEDRFRMWYQTHVRGDQDAGTRTQYAIAYAESKDGLTWKRPKLNLFEWRGARGNNIVLRGPRNARASGPQILLTLPEDQRRGYRYVMSYRTGGSGKATDGIRLVGSRDGIHWDEPRAVRIKHLHSDTLNSIVHDPRRKEFVMFCRPKHVYRTFRGPIRDTGASRVVARLAHDELWTEWPGDPQVVLIPDELDAVPHRYHFFYGMPTHHYGGLYWGFLWSFRMNDPIVTQLATSRDGLHWNRLPSRPNVVGLGSKDAWDDGMVFAGPHWVEVGDEWWFYYAGYDDGHQSATRRSGVGLATLRKEGLVSLHGPANGGGVVVTRRLRWPGGDLVLNVEAPKGEVSVRLSDADRKVLPGFDYEDCVPFTGDSVAHRVRWRKAEIADLAGRVIRIEFFLRDADLYTLRADDSKPRTR